MSYIDIQNWRYRYFIKTPRVVASQKQTKSRIEEILNQPCTLYGQHYAMHTLIHKCLASSSIATNHTPTDGQNIMHTLPFVHRKKINYKICLY